MRGAERIRGRFEITRDMDVWVLPGKPPPPPADLGDNDACFRYSMEPAEWVSDSLYTVPEREASDPAMVHIRSTDDTAHGTGSGRSPCLRSVTGSAAEG